MLSKEESLRILSREKNYEDELVRRLFDYFLNSLGDISGISEEEAEQVRKTLQVIATDSQRHSYMFGMLMQEVLESGKDSF